MEELRTFPDIPEEEDIIEEIDDMEKVRREVERIIYIK